MILSLNSFTLESQEGMKNFEYNTKKEKELYCEQQYEMEFESTFKKRRISYLGHKQIEPFLIDKDGYLSCLELNNYLKSINKGFMKT